MSSDFFLQCYKSTAEGYVNKCVHTTDLKQTGVFKPDFKENSDRKLDTIAITFDLSNPPPQYIPAC